MMTGQPVLILVVMDNSLVLVKTLAFESKYPVLILVVMDNSLVLWHSWVRVTSLQGLNPCCNGQ